MIPWKLIVSLIGAFILILFVVINGQNTAEIRFWFGDKGEQEMNVILALLGAFFTGVLVTLPYVFKKRVHYIDLSREKRKQEKAAKKAQKDAQKSTAGAYAATGSKAAGAKGVAKTAASAAASGGTEARKDPSMEFKTLKKKNSTGSGERK